MNLRYQNLISAVEEALTNSKKSKPFRILETGSHDGTKARQMIDRAAAFGRNKIEYFGFDFFEQATPDVLYSEYLTIPPVRTLEACLNNIQRNSKATKVELFAGDSKDTLRIEWTSLEQINVIFINGGHTLNTIQSDFELALKLADDNTEIVINHYYPGDYSKGSAFLVDNDLVNRSNLTVKICEPSDVLSDEIEVKLVRVKKVAEESVDEVAERAVEYVEPIVEPAQDSDNNPDVQPLAVCTTRCENSTCEHAAELCDGSRRCESRVGSVNLELPTAGPLSEPQVSEERQEPDAKLELGTVESKGTADTDSDSDEQRRDVSKDVEQVDSKGSGKKSGRSRRSRNKRTWSQTDSADKPSDDELSAD
jgi:hypothetical protein